MHQYFRLKTFRILISFLPLPLSLVCHFPIFYSLVPIYLFWPLIRVNIVSKEYLYILRKGTESLNNTFDHSSPLSPKLFTFTRLTSCTLISINGILSSSKNNFSVVILDKGWPINMKLYQKDNLKFCIWSYIILDYLPRQIQLLENVKNFSFSQ